MKRMVREQKAICSEAAQVLKDIVEYKGLTARFVHLGGHIVLEVFINERWYVADPDYGVAYEAPLEVLETRNGESRIKTRMARRGHSAETIQHVIKIFRESDKNWRLPEGTVLSPRLYIIEKAADYLKWIIPSIFLVLGIVKKKAEKNTWRL